MNAKKFVEFDSQGKPWGIVSAEQLWGNVFALKYNRPEKKLSENQWRSLIQEAKRAAMAFGAQRVGTRIRLEYEPELFKKLFGEVGLSKIAGRIEYQCDVSKLPSEKGTPIKWQTARELAWTAYHLTKKCTSICGRKKSGFTLDWTLPMVFAHIYDTFRTRWCLG